MHLHICVSLLQVCGHHHWCLRSQKRPAHCYCQYHYHKAEPLLLQYTQVSDCLTRQWQSPLDGRLFKPGQTWIVIAADVMQTTDIHMRSSTLLIWIWADFLQWNYTQTDWIQLWPRVGHCHRWVQCFWEEKKNGFNRIVLSRAVPFLLLFQ